MSNVSKVVGAMCLVIVLTSCVKRVTVVPVGPDNVVLDAAEVRADGRAVGVGATSVVVGSLGTTVEIAAGPEWRPASARLDPHSPGRLEVAVRPDELFRATVSDENRVANVWINITIAPERTGTWWSTAVNAISGGDFEIEIMDQASGFLRTAWRQASFGDLLCRRRFVGNIVTQEPLVWRFRYEIEMSDDGGNQWVAYDRVFGDDTRISAEIRGRTEH